MRWCIIALAFLFINLSADAENFESFKADFISGYQSLNLPSITYDYREYFISIPSEKEVEGQQSFFQQFKKRLATSSFGNLTSQQSIQLGAIRYEVDLNLQRTRLELGWIRDDRKVPIGGLSSLVNGKDWYQFFVRRFTTTNITPEEVFKMGQSEVGRVQMEIQKLRQQSGFASDSLFYQHLASSSFYLTDKNEIIRRFAQIDSVVRSHLPGFVAAENLPAVYPMEWPGAGPNTPPGMYINHDENAYGKDVFQFNFYGSRYNYRAMDWLYMHEAIPGHHLQSSMRAYDSLLSTFLYPGNFEGWACYVEYYGKELGLYADPYMELGKWEWDLVRSIRLVLDAGIHYYGWSREKALVYWKQYIRGQDDIAEREVTRVTNWTAQALSYKVGADFIFKMQEEWLRQHKGSLKDFRTAYLRAGTAPLIVVQQNLGL